MAFDNGVATPGGASFNAPLLDFSAFGNLANDYYQGIFNKQQVGLNQDQSKLNKARLDQINQQIELSKAFAGGLPTDPATGQIDYRKAAAILAAKGDIGSAVSLLQQQPPAPSALLPGQGGGGAPNGAQGAPASAQPASVPAKPLPPPAANSPKGDSGQNTITSMVTDRLPSQNITTGDTINKMAQMMGIDPNADLTPGQLRRAQGLLDKYAPQIAGVGGGGNLPPSANAVTPAAARPGAQPAQQPQAAPQPQQPAQQPLVPQVPLPPGFNDPQKAIMAIREEAARYAAMPNGKAQAALLENYAQRIEDSVKPIDMVPGRQLVDPRTGKVLYQAPQTNLKDVALRRFLDEHPDATAEDIQKFVAAGRPARSAAAMSLQKFLEENPNATAEDIQNFNASQVSKSTAARTRAGREENLNLILKAADAAIPAALEASKNLPRSNYVPLNRLIQKGEIMSSDPRLVAFGMANLQLAEHWARAMNPTGVMRESDRDKALTFLDTAYGNNTYESAVMQLQKQITRERDAVTGGSTVLKGGKAPDPAADLSKTPDAGGSTKKAPAKDGGASDSAKPQGTTPTGVKWSVE